MASRLTTLVILLLVGTYLACAGGSGVISARLQKRLIGGGGGEPQDVMVSFDQNIQTVLEQINSMNFTDDGEKRTAQTNAQEQFTEAAQGPLKGFLQTQGVQSESFWINNKMIVPNASPQTINAIASFPGVSKVEEEPVVQLNLPYVGKPEVVNRAVRQSPVTWGIARVRADQVWDSYDGTGIVVANIDTGVRHTHESLRGRWRTEKGWYDPYWGTRTPRDRNGHGTHTMGTIAGSKGIGVAPNATWIACKGCSTFGCTARALFGCGQFVQCPHDARNKNDKNCAMAPHVSSNSWGGGQNDGFYDEVIESWQNVGIIPVFSNGNDGPECETAGSPGDRPKVIGVGSTEEDDTISSFSSLGPAANNTLKPDISAPGGRVYSAWHTNDRAYNSISGTSMACPHVSGVIALMKQKKPSLTYDDIYDIITKTASTSVKTEDAKTCGDLSGSSFPNNVFGYGIVDAVDSVNAS